MFYGYLEQIERLKAKIEEKDTSQLHFLDLRKDGFLDPYKNIVYKTWKEIEKKLSGTIIVDDIPNEEISKE